MTDDLEERAWWVFELPGGALAHVPAASEPEARATLERTCYPGARVGDFPFVSSRWTSRESLVRTLVRPRAAAATNATRFKVGDIVHTYAHWGRWRVKFAGPHSDGPMICVVEDTTNPGTEFFDIESNFWLADPCPTEPSAEGTR